VNIFERSLHLGGAAEIGRKVRFAKEFFLAKMGFIYKGSKFLAN
jgi:hypothetical protein